MMKIMKSLIFTFLCVLSLNVFSQAPVFEDLVFEEDSINKVYKPNGKNFAFVKSKRGGDGVAKTSKIDSILTQTISEIVLVYSESASSVSREEANKERWESLLKTYPEVFQFSTNYKNLLQYGRGGDSLAKKAQGFYIYFGNNEVKEDVKPVAEVPKPKEKTEPKEKEKKEKEKKEVKSEPVAETKPKKEKKEKVEKEPEVKEVKEKKERKSKEEKKEEKIVEKKEEPVVEPEPAKPVVKRQGYSKPKRAKNPKACRQPCYEGGDEGLNNFLTENILLSKKQKKHSKSLVSKVKLQLNFDGSIKKSFITGENEEFNKLVTTAVGNMDLWNPAVKNGLTVKSEITMTLVYDKDSKGIKATEINIIPRPGPKCECVSDAEMFGTE